MIPPCHRGRTLHKVLCRCLVFGIVLRTLLNLNRRLFEAGYFEYFLREAVLSRAENFSLYGRLFGEAVYDDHLYRRLFQPRTLDLIFSAIFSVVLEAVLSRVQHCFIFRTWSFFILFPTFFSQQRFLVNKQLRVNDRTTFVCASPSSFCFKSSP